MDEKDALQKAIDRAKRGDFREYWLQQYIKDNHKKLGFERIRGPFSVGPDFKGIRQGQTLSIEAERVSSNFILHGHDLSKVDLLIVLKDDTNRIFRKMQPMEWRKKIPSEIIVVDPEDFVKSTHEARKAYAIKKEADEKHGWSLVPLQMLKHSFALLWQMFSGEEIPFEGTPESYIFDEVLTLIAIEYVNTYNLKKEDLEFGSSKSITKIDYLVDQIITSKRTPDELSKEEREFIQTWLNALYEEYAFHL